MSSFNQKVTSADARVAMAEPKVRAVYEKIAAKKSKRPSPALPGTDQPGRCAPGASVDMAVSDYYFKGKDLLSKK